MCLIVIKNAVRYLVDNEISNGLTESQFGTDESIKRADAAVWVVRALGFENIIAPDSDLRMYRNVLKMR